MSLRAAALWDTLVGIFLAISPVLQQAHQAVQTSQILDRLFQSVSESTCMRYCQSLLRFLQVFEELRGTVCGGFELFMFLDAFAVLARQPSGPLTAPVNVLKALRWIKKLFELPWPDLASPMFRALEARRPGPRRESVPFPAAFIAFLEAVVIQGDIFPRFYRLFSGAILTCIYASLRWSDAQSVLWDAIFLDIDTLRSTAVRTKVSTQGMPFAIWREGIQASSGFSWVDHWVWLLGEVFSEVREVLPDFTPDVLFFSWQDGMFEPLSYAASLRALRELLQESGLFGASQIQEFTLHSAKATVLSMAIQLNVSEFLRAFQGHHRMTKLYSRDDVHYALQVQRSVLDALRSGWLPRITMLRGAAPPVQQPACTILSCVPPAAVHPFFAPHSSEQHGQVATAQPSSSEPGAVQQASCSVAMSSTGPPESTVSSEQGIASSSDEESVPPALLDLGAPEELCVWKAPSGVYHAGDPAKDMLPACGVRSARLESVAFLPAGGRLCKRPACMKIFELPLA